MMQAARSISLVTPQLRSAKTATLHAHSALQIRTVHAVPADWDFSWTARLVWMSALPKSGQILQIEHVKHAMQTVLIALGLQPPAANASRGLP